VAFGLLAQQIHQGPHDGPCVLCHLLTSSVVPIDAECRWRPAAAKLARQRNRRYATLDSVDDEDPELYIVDFSDSDAATDYQRRVEHARTVARRRYHDYLAAAFDLYGCTDSGALADVALDSLTEWRDVDDGRRCPCSCHPRLPESDFHDYGFGCSCGQTAQDRRHAWEKWKSDREAFWRSPEGQRIEAAERADEAELRAWLAAHDGIVVRSHGGLAPEQWRGEVDGHSFYFRERHAEWRIELDLRPSGHFAHAFVGVDTAGDVRYEERELDEGDVIAQGTIDDDGYGSTPVERARFIVDTIRVHLAQKACTLHAEDLSSIEALLGHGIRWCPACGTRLGAG
jgi:hypothetical protein